MNKGLMTVLVALAALSASPAVVAEGEIYKIVNPDGSVTFTDQKPAPGAQPVELKPLSVVETDIDVPDTAAADVEGAAAEEPEPTQRDLRRMYNDFSIIQPRNEETFWGTENQVAVSWGASQPPREGMQVVLYVNGEGQQAPGSGTAMLTLDRGEHQVYAVLRDAGGRQVAATDTVTFFVKQHSVNFNRGN